jgi:hypothetical protein
VRLAALPYRWRIPIPRDGLDPELPKEMGEDHWTPGFADYLFLAFNTSTAFSPTDVPVLSLRPKS